MNASAVAQPVGAQRQTNASALIVQQDTLARALLARRLASSELTVELCGDGTAALERLASRRFELVLIDWSLPGTSGLELLVELRRRGDSGAIIMLAPRVPADAGPRALNSGADDFVHRSCTFEELLARARAVLRRTSNRPGPLLACADLALDPVRRKVSRAGQEIRLSAREFMLLQHLMTHLGQPQSRVAIIQSVWEDGAASNVVDVYIRHLRRKVDAPFGRALIHTVRRHGYVVSESP